MGTSKDKEVKVEAYNNGVTLVDAMTTHADGWLAAIDADINSAITKAEANAAFGQYLDTGNYIFPLVDAIETVTVQAEDTLFEKWFTQFGEFFGDKKKAAVKTQWNRVRQLMRQLRKAHKDGESKASFSSELQTLKRNCKFYFKTGQTKVAKTRCEKTAGDKDTIKAIKKAAPKKKAFKVTGGNCKETVKRIVENLKAEKIRLTALRTWTVEKEQDPKHTLQENIDKLATIIESITTIKKLIK